MMGHMESRSVLLEGLRRLGDSAYVEVCGLLLDRNANIDARIEVS